MSEMTRQAALVRLTAMDDEMGLDDEPVASKDDGRCPNCGEDELDGARCYYCGFHDYNCGLCDECLATPATSA